MRWGRIILAVILAELAAVVLLVVLVFLTGPSDPDGATRYAEEIGRWVGPVGGSLATFFAAWWAARGSAKPLASGVAVGAIAAVLDVAILLVSADRFDWLFAASNVLRVVAGFLGGRFAASRGARLAPPAA